MSNFIKYYSYFVSEYIVEDLYPSFAPNDNMVSSGTNMLSCIAELGSHGKMKVEMTRDIYKALGQVVESLFLGDEQFFVTKDGVIFAIKGTSFNITNDINRILVSGATAKQLLERIESGELWVSYAIIEADDKDLVSKVGERCLLDVLTKEGFVGAIPQIKMFTEVVKDNLDSPSKNVFIEQYTEYSTYSILDFL